MVLSDVQQAVCVVLRPPAPPDPNPNPPAAGRDENGFKCHTMSESHQRQLLLVAENPNKFVDRAFPSPANALAARALSRRRVLERV